jgi:8-oxo-dGTP diphosphatase
LHGETKAVRVGVGVIVVRDAKVLFGLRRGSHGGGTWSFPGGHLDAGETVEACALRELHEETGLQGASPRVVGTTDDVFPDGRRYRTYFVEVESADGEPSVREPDACARWSWFSWSEPPEPLFLPIDTLRKSGFRPAEGRVEAIHVAADAGEPVQAVESAHAIAHVGLEGDRYAAGRGHYRDGRVSRDLTLIEAEVIEAVAHELGLELAPGETRRNVTTRGVRLNELVGRRFWVGEVLCRGTHLCEPCRYLTELTGKPLLQALVHRGGLRAEILRGGLIRRADTIRLADDE